MNSGVMNDTRRGTLPPPFSIRFTESERARLVADAGTKPLAAHIRAKLFDGAQDFSRNRPLRKVRAPKVDHAALARALAALGASRIASNLNLLAKAANMGTLPLTPEVVEELLAIMADIRVLRSDLIAAMGLNDEDTR